MLRESGITIFESVLIFFESRLKFFESRLMFFESVLKFCESVLMFFEYVLIFFESVLKFCESRGVAGGSESSDFGRKRDETDRLARVGVEFIPDEGIPWTGRRRAARFIRLGRTVMQASVASDSPGYEMCVDESRRRSVQRSMQTRPRLMSLRIRRNG
jgi:hypothetical protein